MNIWIKEPVRLCKDCRHRRDTGRCEAPQNRIEHTNLVTGEVEVSWHYAYCGTHRAHKEFFWKSHMCGKQGRWFEPKEQS
jgi:hypothetical protein